MRRPGAGTGCCGGGGCGGCCSGGGGGGQSRVQEPGGARQQRDVGDQVPAPHRAHRVHPQRPVPECGTVWRLKKALFTQKSCVKHRFHVWSVHNKAPVHSVEGGGVGGVHPRPPRRGRDVEAGPPLQPRRGLHHLLPPGAGVKAPLEVCGCNFCSCCCCNCCCCCCCCWILYGGGEAPHRAPHAAPVLVPGPVVPQLPGYLQPVNLSS